MLFIKKKKNKTEKNSARGPVSGNGGVLGNDRRDDLSEESFEVKYVDAGKLSECAYWRFIDQELVFYGKGPVKYINNQVDVETGSRYDPHNLSPWYDHPGFDQNPRKKQVSAIRVFSGITSIETDRPFIFPKLRYLFIPPCVDSVCDGFISPIHGADRITVIGEKGSAAEEYAKRNSFIFEVSEEETPYYKRQVTRVPSKHYWRSDIALFRNGASWVMEIEDTYARDSFNDDTTCVTETLPDKFPNMTAEELSAYLNSLGVCGPHIYEENVRRCVKPNELKDFLLVARIFE